MGLRYAYQQIAPSNPEDLSTIDLEKFPKSAFPIKQSAIGPSFLYDRRDDVLNPQTGLLRGPLAGNYAFPFLNADAHYGKVSGQAAWFASVLGGVLGVPRRAWGAIFPDGRRRETRPFRSPKSSSPGGSSTARGFDTDLEGIPACQRERLAGHRRLQHAGDAPLGNGHRDPAPSSIPDAARSTTAAPARASSAATASWPGALEYRVPIARQPGHLGLLRSGAGLGDPGDIHFASRARTGLRQSIGAGLHYMTPIGPLRLEYAQPVQLRTIPFEVTSTVEPDGSPCDPSPCKLATGSTKEKGRVLLSIGYPF